MENDFHSLLKSSANALKGTKGFAREEKGKNKKNLNLLSKQSLQLIKGVCL